MSILLHCKPDRQERWKAALNAAIPDSRVHIWPDTGHLSEVELIVTATALPIDYSAFPKVRFIATTGAGVEHLTGTVARIPAHLPIVRVVDPKLTRSMAEYVLTAVLRYHREFHEFEAAQRSATWQLRPRRDPDERIVGILGLGALGQASGQLLASLGFRVHGWSRRPKQIEGIQCHCGGAGLSRVLAQSEILVCLLPLTEGTQGILDADALSLLPRGATLINVGRGRHIVEADLLSALATGHISHATLDVFVHEPLPNEHPFWRHPRITVTPHIASLTVPESAVAGIAEALRMARAGMSLPHTVDRVTGY